MFRIRNWVSTYRTALACGVMLVAIWAPVLGESDVSQRTDTGVTEDVGAIDADTREPADVGSNEDDGSVTSSLLLGSIIYVDPDATGTPDGTTWCNAFLHLQDALAVAVATDEIRVAQGTFMPDGARIGDAGYVAGSGTRTGTFQLINAVTIEGGYAGCGAPDSDERDIALYETILSGDLNADDGPDFANNDENSYHVVTGSGTDSTAILDGFTITAGNADGSSPHGSGGGMYNFESNPTLVECTFNGNLAWADGGGMYNYEYSSPTLSNCRFTRNTATRGGGMYNYQHSSPTLSNCAFSGNLAGSSGGGMYNYGDSSPILSNCAFSGNIANDGYGGGMQNYLRSSPTLTDCTFGDNLAVEGGGGMFNWAGSSPTLMRCMFKGNSAGESGGGGMGTREGSPTLINCAFTGNSASDFGGAMTIWWGSTPTLTNCAFSGNSCGGHGGAIFNWCGANPMLVNCVFAGNSAANGTAVACDCYWDNPSTVQITNSVLWDGGDEVWNNDTSTITISYSNVQGGWTGVGNIDDNPLFVDADGGDDTVGTEDDDLHLRGGSPCIDAADNEGVLPDTADLDADGDTNEPTPFDLDGNPRFIDDPTVDPDPGNGTPPIVDMGPYEYQADCNNNGVIDSVDISEGTSEDCTGNGIPDECEPDCNDSGTADSCDIADGTSEDCTGNTVPDECEPDCNGNGTADSCDIADGTSEDCNSNSIPDECDTADGTSQDCNSNGIPDECEPEEDCNDNGVQDICDIADGTSQDCNANGIPDECDVAGVAGPELIPFEFAPFSLDWTDSDDDNATGSVDLPWGVEMGGETFTAFEQDSNGYVELLRVGESPYGYGYGNVDDLINYVWPAGLPTHTFLMTAYDDLDSSYYGEYGYDIQDDRVVFYWKTETYCDGDYDLLNVFQLVLYSDGRVQWNFDSAEYECWDYDLSSGMYLGYDRQELFEIYRNSIPVQESWLFAEVSPLDCNGNGIPDECEEGLPPECLGACCNFDGAGGCSDLSLAECDAVGGVFVGLGTSCLDVPDPCTHGACCDTNTGACTITDDVGCAAQAGDYLGVATNCDPNPCPQPQGCCFGDGSCQDLPTGVCTDTGGTAQGFGTACLGDSDANGTDDACEFLGCPGSGGCCTVHSSTGCDDVLCCAAVCASLPECCLEEWYDYCAEEAFLLCGDLCPSEFCPGYGNCCVANTLPGCNDGECCAAVCAIDPYCCVVEWDSICVAEAVELCTVCGGACCDFDGSGGCNDMTQPDCNAVGGVFVGPGTSCSDAPDPCTHGACCHPVNGTCTITDDVECAAQGGNYLGVATPCDPNPCPQPPPPNDQCQNALPIFNGSTGFDTTEADTDGPPHPDACEIDGQTYHDIWYDYEATCTGTLTVSTCNSALYDTDLAVYAGCECPVSDANLLGCNNDGAGCAGYTSEVSVLVEQGNCYKIRVGGSYDFDFGPGTVNVSCADAPTGACCDRSTGTCTIEANFQCDCFLCDFYQDMACQDIDPPCVLGDCNANGIDDSIDIAGGTSDDCNNDGTPDECEEDCNVNSVPDDCDVDPTDPDGNGQVSNDCNGDLVPDECEDDCQPNGVPDECDIDATDPDGDGQVSDDCDADGVPDECEPDCNGNGVVDACDVDSTDPDGNTEVSEDCNDNIIPDECELGGCCEENVFCADAMLTECEGVPGAVWLGPCVPCPEQNAGLFEEAGGEIFVHVIGPPVECPSPGGRRFARQGCPPDPAYFVDPWKSPANAQMCHTFGVQGSPAIPPGFFDPGSDAFQGSICLEGVPLGVTGYGDFGDADTLVKRSSLASASPDPFDRCDLPFGTPVTVAIEVVELALVNGAPIVVTYGGGTTSEFWDAAVDLSPTFTPPVGTLTATKTHCNGGTYVSRLNVQPRFTFTRQSDGAVRVLDTGENCPGVDCIPHVVLYQTAPAPWVHDVDPNIDLNGDPCSQFHAGLEDQNPQTACDCNGNLMRDLCDIEGGFSADCNANLIPDDCEPDCTGDGTPDDCEINECVNDPTCDDCNGNGLPDGCDIDLGYYPDCNANSVPDNCEPDCNGNSVADACELDTDGDSSIDECDPDDDNDCVLDGMDIQPLNPDICGDEDGDGCDDCAIGADDFGPLCDNDPSNDGPDADTDGICDSGDNCPTSANSDQTDSDGDGFGDVCDAATPLPAPYPHDRRKNRYFSFDPNKAGNDGTGIAFRVELEQITLGSCDGPTGGATDFCREDRGTDDCSACSAVGNACISAPIDCTPGQTCDATGETCVNDAPDVGGSNVGHVWWVGPESPLGNSVHLVVSEPFRKVSSDWPNPTHAGDCEVVPQAVYGVWAIRVSNGAESDELPVETTLYAQISLSWWADCVGPLKKFCGGDIRTPECVSDAECTTPPTCDRAWTLPDGAVNVDDITAALWTSAPAPPTTVSADFTWVDLHGNGSFLPGSQAYDPPNYVINVSDLQQVISGFGGFPYKGHDPADCPDESEWP